MAVCSVGVISSAAMMDKWVPYWYLLFSNGHQVCKFCLLLKLGFMAILLWLLYQWFCSV